MSNGGASRKRTRSTGDDSEDTYESTSAGGPSKVVALSSDEEEELLHASIYFIEETQDDGDEPAVELTRGESMPSTSKGEVASLVRAPARTTDARKEPSSSKNIPGTSSSNARKEIGIVDIRFPKVRIDSKRKMKMSTNLLRLLVKKEMEGSDFVPKLGDATLQELGVVVTYHDMESLEFLRQNLDKICPAAVASGRREDCCLKLMEVTDMMTRIQLSAFIPNTEIGYDELITIIRAANRDQRFETNEWSLIRTENKSSEGFIAILDIDPVSFQKIQASGMELRLGWDRIFFRRFGGDR